jgi:hypothetical protein
LEQPGIGECSSNWAESSEKDIASTACRPRGPRALVSLAVRSTESCQVHTPAPQERVLKNQAAQSHLSMRTEGVKVRRENQRIVLGGFAKRGVSARSASLRAGVRRKEEVSFARLYGTTSQPSIRCTHLRQNAKVVP